MQRVDPLFAQVITFDRNLLILFAGFLCKPMAEACIFDVKAEAKLLIYKNHGRGERIRTSDPLVPNQVLYQAEPLPEPMLQKRIAGRCLVRWSLDALGSV